MRYPKQEPSLFIQGSSKIPRKFFSFLSTLIEKSNENPAIKNTKSYNTFKSSTLKDSIPIVLMTATILKVFNSLYNCVLVSVTFNTKM